MSSTNFNNILFSSSTHTECLDITCILWREPSLETVFFTAELVSVELEDREGTVITKAAIETAFKWKKPEAIVIRPCRMMPLNFPGNIPYRPTVPSRKSCVILRESRIKHLLIDLPSVDKGKDEGNSWR
jgi:hypothetical protein